MRLSTNFALTADLCFTLGGRLKFEELLMGRMADTMGAGILFLCIWIAGCEFWFFANLFDESLGFVYSFKPLCLFETTKSGQLPYRLGIGTAFFWILLLGHDATINFFSSI